jgi:AcrR family transcriptional regulator
LNMFKLNAFKVARRRDGTMEQGAARRGGARRAARAQAVVETDGGAEGAGPGEAGRGEIAGTGRGERTRELILGTALELFRERGYEETTMRAIAQQAGVSLGNAYYYFRSKEHLIQAFYALSHREHLEASRPILEREKELAARLKGVLYAKVSTSEPYHHFSGILFKTAADPNSPLSPFSPDSHPVRQESTALFAEVLLGSKTRVPDDLKEELPNLLWLYQMGIVLFWIHDGSPERRRTYTLVDHTVDLVARTIGLAGNPLLIPLRRRVLRLLADLRREAVE